MITYPNSEYTATQRQTGRKPLAQAVLRPLSLILLIQAAVANILLHNTAFLDEATYIYAGEQIPGGLANIAQYATYFSGYPGFYPVIAGALNQIGGLTLVRLFSTACMLVVTSCVFLTTERLFNRTSAYAAAILFAFTGPTLFLTRLATFDALALMFLAMATTLAVSVASTQRLLGTGMSLYIALLLVLAVAAKYAVLIFAPFVIALLALHTAQQQGWSRGRYYLILTIGGMVSIAWIALTHVTNTVLQGISSTTTGRTAMIPESRSALLAFILQAGWIIWLLGLFGLLLLPGRQLLISRFLLIASFAAPAYHLFTTESVSLYKHMAFAMFFAAPVAGAALASAAQHLPSWWRSHWLPRIVSTIGTTLGCIVLLARAANSAQMNYAAWPNTSQLAATMAPLLSGKPVQCLCEDANVLQYELADTTSAGQYTDPYYFKYQTHGQTLFGNSAYTAAIDAGFFGVVELNFHDAIAGAVVAAIQSGPTHYRLVAKLPQSGEANSYFLVWVKAGPLSTQVIHVVGTYLVTTPSQSVSLRGVDIAPPQMSGFCAPPGGGVAATVSAASHAVTLV